MIKLLFISVFILHSLSQLTHAGSEKGNGGVGVKCGDEIFILEEYQARKANIELEEFSSEAELLEKVKLKLGKKSSGFYLLIEGAAKTMGTFESWEKSFLIPTYDSFYYNELPRECSLIQIAFQARGFVYIDTELSSKLSKLQKQILWIHEILYNLGSYQFKHTNSVLIRRLVTDIFSIKTKKISPRHVESFKNNFIRLPTKDLREIKDDGLLRTFKYSLERYSNLPDQNHKCPTWFAMDYNGDKGIALSLLYNKLDFQDAQEFKEKKGEFFLKSYNVNLSKRNSASNDTENTSFKMWYYRSTWKVVLEKKDKKTNETNIMLIGYQPMSSGVVIDMYKLKKGEKFEPISKGGTVNFGPDHWISKTQSRGKQCLYRATDLKDGIFLINQKLEY